MIDDMDANLKKDAIAWDEMRKARMKSREAGKDLTRLGVPAKASASLLQYLTEMVTDVLSS